MLIVHLGIISSVRMAYNAIKELDDVVDSPADDVSAKGQVCVALVVPQTSTHIAKYIELVYIEHIHI